MIINCIFRGGTQDGKIVGVRTFDGISLPPYVRIMKPQKLESFPVPVQKFDIAEAVIETETYLRIDFFNNNGYCGSEYSIEDEG